MSQENDLMKNKVFIVTEGSKHIGFGHLMRCSAFYDAFVKVRKFPVFIIHGDKSARQLMKDKPCLYFNWINNKEKLYRQIKGADVVFIDSYLGRLEIYKEVAKLAKLLVSIDDYGRIKYPKGIVLNGAINIDKQGYSVLKEVIPLVGVKYFPMRKEFWSIIPKKISEKINNILVTFGGSDPRNLTPKVLKILVKYFPDLRKIVVVGMGFSNKKEINFLRDKYIKIVYNPPSRKIIKLMQEADLAISTGGQTLYELARIGTPTLAIAIAHNQMNNIKGWLGVGFIEFLGTWQDKKTLSNIPRKIYEMNSFTIRKERSKIGQKYVDGRGCRRVVNKIYKLLKK